MPVPSPIYEQLTAAALPTLVEYKTDLTRHDFNICRVLEAGDAAMYAVRTHGTHFCTYRDTANPGPAAAQRTAQRALDYVDAVHGVAPDARWFKVECTAPGVGIVTPTTFTRARAVVLAERDNRAGELIRSTRRFA